jgi:hypothetical protein
LLFSRFLGITSAADAPLVGCAGLLPTLLCPMIRL